ncbi:MAG: alpha-L-fucosidase [Coraliomargarita sp.]
MKVTNEAGWWWELCIKAEKTDTPYWHYNESLETNHWDASKLLSEWVRCRSLGGNLLVNITPRPNGEMMDWFYDVCEEMAGWMAHSREAVVGVDLDPPLPMLDKTLNYTTKKGSVWYSMADEAGRVFIREVAAPQSVSLLRTGEALPFQHKDGALLIQLPESKLTSLPDMVKISL